MPFDFYLNCFSISIPFLNKTGIVFVDFSYAQEGLGLELKTEFAGNILSVVPPVSKN